MRIFSARTQSKQAMLRYITDLTQIVIPYSEICRNAWGISIDDQPKDVLLQDVWGPRW